MAENPAFEIRQVAVRKDGFGLSPPIGSPEYYREMDLHARPAEAAELILPPSPGRPPPPSAAESAQRVFITCGRGDSFVLAVEEGPEWDAVWQRKFDVQTVLAILPILRALGTRILDRTGGELLVAEQEADDERTTPRGQSRKPGSQAIQSSRGVRRASSRVQEDFPPGVLEEIAALGGNGSP